MKKLKPKPHQFWAWCSTLTILLGAITASLGFYPLYCYIFLVGNTGLAIVSWLWNEKSLVALNTVLLVLLNWTYKSFIIEINILLKNVSFYHLSYE